MKHRMFIPALALCLGCAIVGTAKGPWQRRRLMPVDLAALFDNDGISSPAKPADGNYDCPDHPANIPGSTYPADHLPAGGQPFSPVQAPGLRFLFPPVRYQEPNNVVCAGQKIEVAPGRYRGLWLLASAENGDHEGTLRLNYDDGRVDVALRFIDWCAQPPTGALVAAACPYRYSWQEDSRTMAKEDIACRLFAVRAPVDERRGLESFNLPYNTRVHVFAISLEAAKWSRGLQQRVDDCVAFYARPAAKQAQTSATLRRKQAALRRRLAQVKAADAEGRFERPLLWLSAQLDYCASLLPRGKREPQPRDVRTIQRTHERARRDLGSVAKGQDPFANRRGVTLKAYVSGIDGQPQPYSVSVPPGYDGTKPMPLVLHLHGHGWYRPFQGHPAPRFAQAIVVSPHGRGSMDYMLVGEADAMSALDEAQRDYNVDPDRIYAMGHSMGGTGSWNLAARHPDLFAAIAPNAGNADHHTWQRTWGWTHDWASPFDRVCAFAEDACDPSTYADNLVNTPAYAIHGADDRVCPVGHTRSMVSQLRARGCPATYKELPGVGHGGFPGPVRAEQREWLFKQVRDPRPSRVVVKTASLRYARSHWLAIEQIDGPLEFARAEGRFTEPNAFEITTSNVSRLTLHFERSPMALSEEPSLVIDAAQVQCPPALREMTFARSEAGAWPLAEPVAGVVKRAGLEGPVEDVFMTPFLVVVGTTAEQELERRIIAEEAQRFVEDWQRLYTRPCRIKKDHEVTEDDVQRYSLVLYGGPRANQITARMAGKLPLRLGPDAIAVAEHRFAGPDVGAKFCCPNPLNPQRYVAVFAATTWKGMFQINTRFGNWFDWGVYDNRNWFDYAVFDDRTRTPDTFCCVGFFGRDWTLDERSCFLGDPERRGKGLPRLVPSAAPPPRGRRRLLLSDLLPVRIRQHKGPVGFDRSFQGQALSVGRKACRKGLGVRAPSRVDFQLPEPFDRFQTWVGVDLEGQTKVNPWRGRSERVQFLVWGDGRRLYMSQWLKWDSKPVRIDIKLEGAAELGLEVRGSGARWLLGSAGWGQACVVKTAKKPARPQRPEDKKP